jgi:proline iminopeptidase
VVSSIEEPRQIKTDEHTIKSGWLEVGHGHKVWYEQWGNKDASVPVLYFHGGPGGGYKPSHKYNLDPKKHQAIIFDQRGCGNSLPYGRTDHNRTEDLINDALMILDELGVKKVHIQGGSWGSTLALLFAIKHPEKCQDLVIRGVFTGTQSEINWIDKGLFINHYPEVWERFLGTVPAENRSKPAEYHYEILNGSDPENFQTSAKALSELEGPLLAFDWPGFNDIQLDNKPNDMPEEFDFVPYKIFAWYLSHSCFLSESYILKNASKINCPLFIIQGRYDMCCPPITAYKIHKLVKNSKLFMTLASHSNDPETRSVNQTLIQTIY